MRNMPIIDFNRCFWTYFCSVANFAKHKTNMNVAKENLEFILVKKTDNYNTGHSQNTLASKGEGWAICWRCYIILCSKLDKEGGGCQKSSKYCQHSLWMASLPYFGNFNGNLWSINCMINRDYFAFQTVIRNTFLWANKCNTNFENKQRLSYVTKMKKKQTMQTVKN